MNDALEKKVVVVGASGFGRECLDVANSMQDAGDGIKVLGVVDDAPSPDNLRRLAKRDVKYLGTIAQWISTGQKDVHFVLGIGNPEVRKKVVRAFERAGFSTLNLIHPSAQIGSSLQIGNGVVICSHAVVSSNVTLGDYCHLNPNSTIGHDANVGDYVSVNPNAVVSGEVVIEPGCLLGANSTVLQGLRIGTNSIVGACACVTKDVASHSIVKGVPAK